MFQTVKWPYLAVTIAYCALLFWLSGGPVPGGIDLSEMGKDKIAHMTAFGILAAWIAFGIRQSNTFVRPAVQFWIPFLVAAGYGMLDEAHQAWVPSRDFDPWDALFDGIGAFLASFLICRVAWRIPFRDCVIGQRAGAEA